MSKPMGPSPTRGAVRGWIHHHIWRVGFMYFAWYLTHAVVWLKNHIHLGSWFGTNIREVALRLWSIAWLAFVWVLLWGSISWANIIGGVVVAILIVALLPLPRVPVEGRIHPITGVRLLLHLFVDFAVSSAQVAWLSIRPQRPPLSAVLRARVAIKSDMVLALAIDYINLVPGTMVVDVDHRRRLLYVHLIDASSEKKVRAFYAQMKLIEKLFVQAFERDSEWHPSPYHGVDEEFHTETPNAAREVCS